MEDAPKVDVQRGEGGRLVYDKARRTIVAENLPCPICGGIEGCDHTAIERSMAAKQMRADFDSIPEGSNVLGRARKLIEDHVAAHGPIPRAESLIDEIAAEMGLLEIYARRKRA